MATLGVVSCGIRVASVGGTFSLRTWSACDLVRCAGANPIRLSAFEPNDANAWAGSEDHACLQLCVLVAFRRSCAVRLWGYILDKNSTIFNAFRH